MLALRQSAQPSQSYKQGSTEFRGISSVAGKMLFWTCFSDQSLMKSRVISAATAASGILLMLDHLCFRNEKDEHQTARHLDYISQCLATVDGLKSNPEVHRRLVALGHLFSSAQDCTLHLPPHKPDIVKYVISHILYPSVEIASEGCRQARQLEDIPHGVHTVSNAFSLSPAGSGVASNAVPTSDPLGWPDDSQGWLDELLPGALEFDTPFLADFP